MPMMKVERFEKTLDVPAGGGNTVIRPLSAGERLLAIKARVRRAGNGSGTVSIGRTGALTDFMSTANVGAGVAGDNKLPTSETGLDGNGYRNAAGADIVVAYTVGTNTVHPQVTVSALIVQEEHFKDMLAG